MSYSYFPRITVELPTRIYTKALAVFMVKDVFIHAHMWFVGCASLLWLKSVLVGPNSSVIYYLQR